MRANDATGNPKVGVRTPKKRRRHRQDPHLESPRTSDLRSFDYKGSHITKWANGWRNRTLRRPKGQGDPKIISEHDWRSIRSNRAALVENGKRYVLVDLFGHSHFKGPSNRI